MSTRTFISCTPIAAASNKVLQTNSTQNNVAAVPSPAYSKTKVSVSVNSSAKATNSALPVADEDVSTDTEKDVNTDVEQEGAPVTSKNSTVAVSNKKKAATKPQNTDSSTPVGSTVPATSPKRVAPVKSAVVEPEEAPAESLSAPEPAVSSTSPKRVARVKATDTSSEVAEQEEAPAESKHAAAPSSADSSAAVASPKRVTPVKATNTSTTVAEPEEVPAESNTFPKTSVPIGASVPVEQVQQAAPVQTTNATAPVAHQAQVPVPVDKPVATQTPAAPQPVAESKPISFMSAIRQIFEALIDTPKTSATSANANSTNPGVTSDGIPLPVAPSNPA